MFDSLQTIQFYIDENNNSIFPLTFNLFMQ